MSSICIPIFIIQLEVDEGSPSIDISPITDVFDADDYSTSEAFVQKMSSVDKKKLRGKRASSAVVVETLRQTTPVDNTVETLPFFSGNPFVEKTHGILHMYKRNSPDVSDDRVSKTVCMLAVPASLGSHDLLQFLAPSGPGITIIRIIRDNTPNQYMVLITFHEQEQANEFYRAFCSKPFSSLEPNVICNLVYVSRVETKKQTEDAGFPIEGHTELPTCPVCLERMDESVDGILTVLCNHSFHASCLNQWGDTSCPVCRYVQTPELTPDHTCSVCGKQEDLWICLLCGNIGCGRYAEAHAALHFEETQHTFALEVGGQRVWDYAGDNYVHRLIQSKSDGKVVEFDNSDEQVRSDEKLDGIQLEYTYLLTNQLESQRLYFEEKVAHVEKSAAAEIDKLERRIIDLDCELTQLKNDLKKCQAEKTATDKKLQLTGSKLQKCQQELKEEQELDAMLRSDQAAWAAKTGELEKKMIEMSAAKDKEMNELQEQLRDLMFHFEAESKLKEAADNQSVPEEELRDSHVLVGEKPSASNATRKTRKKK